MIAHKKQFKIAGAIWLVIVMTICQIVPAFASVSTDESGNASPRSYRITWYIYSTESETYQEANVTSQVTIDGLKFTFPTNLYGVNRLSFRLDFLGSGTSTYIQSASISYFVSYSSSSYEGLCSIVDESTFNWYYFRNGSSNSVRLEKYLTGTSNPNSFDIVRDSPSPFSFCMMSFFPDAVYLGGNFSITFTEFKFDDIDISSYITTENLDNASEDLSNLAEDLAVPTPNSDAIFNGMDDAINHVNDSNYQSTYSFFKNDTGIMATYITIVLAMATLGYIFFGKRSA